MILGSQAGEGLRRVDRGLDDSGLFDYLADEVLEAQPASTQRFLLETPSSIASPPTWPQR